MSDRQQTRQWEPRTKAVSSNTRTLVDEAVEAQFLARASRLSSIGKSARRNRGKNKEKERRTVEAMVLDTLAHQLGNLPEHLVIKLNNNWLSGGPPDIIARNRTVIDRLYDLEESGWLKADKNTRANNHFVTSLSAGSKLMAASNRLVVSLSDIGVEPAPAEIELRGHKPKGAGARRPVLRFEPSAITRSIRQQLELLNTHLGNAELSSVKFGDSMIDTRRRTLSRAFLDGSFERGGRLNGPAFWLSLRKDIRRAALRIDGEPIAEVDIRAAMPSIAYALENIRPSKDPYQLEQPEDIPRDGIKIALMQMLWTPISKSSRLAAEARILVPKAYTAKQVFQYIRQHNAPIAHRLGAQAPCGAELMWHESEVIIDATLRCFSAGLSALPLHDALLVPVSRELEAKYLLSAAFEDRLGVEPLIKVDLFNDTIGRSITS